MMTYLRIVGAILLSVGLILLISSESDFYRGLLLIGVGTAIAILGDKLDND